MKRYDRRTFLGSAGALAGLPMFGISPAFAQAVKLSMGVGLAQESGALIMKMRQDNLLEQAAKE